MVDYSDLRNTDRMHLALIKDNISECALKWLEKAGQWDVHEKLAEAFVILPRKTGRSTLKVTEEQHSELQQAGIHQVANWTTDRLSRVWLLSVPRMDDAEKFHSVIENLFLSAEINEAVALYSALPFLAGPENWVKRCSEGIRSNIGPVLEAIVEDNPYPAKYLGEAAWNQLILKAFFTEKNIGKIQGLGKRANQSLALALSDYALERYAAGRKVNPQLWQLTVPFINDKIFKAVSTGLNCSGKEEREAILYAIATSNFGQTEQISISSPSW
jgi:hypothetical protein